MSPTVYKYNIYKCAKNSSFYVNLFRLVANISVVVKPAMDVFIDLFISFVHLCCGRNNPNSHINITAAVEAATATISHNYALHISR